MPAWREARYAGKGSRNKQVKERTPNDIDAGVGHYVFNPEKPLCLYCKNTKNCLTGYLSVTGAIWFCKHCRIKYESDKIWEKSL